ncbi:LD-carboxypeptidase [Prauserella marina]|uniref:Muramoyltetrapeptide carboxypeptidase n=1 Tax=Prauserella marina TaxID=530584 RepID=A0A222VQJ7_9PSEU|nr:LD-carboxypeptidase [Prauserella marina]ASR36164.1 LD-carboxypeptidase [Prauserella marina]PWV76913.1 muramoyltetrapeptide carboxypeptidase [Prauserella marina]SDD00261.1 muramoyltetrapeptide carboxypeptidase [Prauserella marina]
MTGLPLAAGDTVALVAPAGPVTEDLLDSAVGTLTSWGLGVRVMPGVLARHPEFRYLAGDDASRAKEFEQAWLADDVAGVFAARGGYGCQRMLDLVDWRALRAAGPKVFAGSSDATALHEAVGVHLGLPTVFCPMPASALFDPVAAEGLRAALFGSSGTLRGEHASALVPGTARGRTVGGSLSLLAAGVGTAEHRGARGGIALLEDVSEEPYRLDRMLTQLLRSGWFAGVEGIALGSWAQCGDAGEIRAVMLDRLAPLGVPVVWELGFGHVPGSLTVPLGVMAELDADAATLRPL